MTWLRSSHCHDAGCVLVAFDGDDVYLRDGKEKDGPVLRFGAEEWRAFVAAVILGDFTPTDTLADLQ